jgi:hypothetical protein
MGLSRPRTWRPENAVTRVRLPQFTHDAGGYPKHGDRVRHCRVLNASFWGLSPGEFLLMKGETSESTSIFGEELHLKKRGEA